MKARKAEEQVFKLVTYASTLLTMIALFGIIGSITLKGMPSINIHYLITSEAGQPGLGGAIGNAIVGTILISASSTIFATPLAIGTAVYLKKYSNEGFLTNLLSFMIEVLAGTPSIVLGIFGFFILVYSMKFITGGFSLISGAIALAILIFPTIERSTEEAIKTVPSELEEASYSLGATKWKTLKLITLPYALNGIITGIVLGVGRAAEESAVVVLTAGYTQFMPEFKIVPNENLIFGLKIYPFQDLVAALPVTVYRAFEFPQLVPISEGFAASFILILIVMLINVITRLIVWSKRIS